MQTSLAGGRRTAGTGMLVDVSSAPGPSLLPGPSSLSSSLHDVATSSGDGNANSNVHDSNNSDGDDNYSVVEVLEELVLDNDADSTGHPTGALDRLARLVANDGDGMWLNGNADPAPVQPEPCQQPQQPQQPQHHTSADGGHDARKEELNEDEDLLLFD